MSRADWLAELRQIRGEAQCAKRSRAQTLMNAKALAEAADEGVRQNGRSWGETPCGEAASSVPPSYFWMVTAPGIIKDNELPEYAGLMEVVPSRPGCVQAHGYMTRKVKPAPRLHRVKMLDCQLMAMARGVTLRYWQNGRVA